MVGSISIAQNPNVSVLTSQPIRPIPTSPAASSPALAQGDSLSLSAAARRAPFNAIEEGKKNTTQGYSRAHMPVPVKTALEPTLRLIDAVEPALAKGLRKLDNNDFGLSDKGIGTFLGKHEIYAAWAPIIREGWSKLHINDMILDDNFWKLRDAEKATILIHEFTHAKEIPILSNFQTLYGSISNLIKKDYGNPVEDRAYLRQLQSFPKLGITPQDDIYWEVKTYLEDRKLWPGDKNA